VANLLLLQFQTIVRFRPYTSMEIEFILRSRVGNILADCALGFISKREAQNSGDIRRAIEATAGAIAEYKETLSPVHLTTLPETLSGLIRIQHAYKAIRKKKEELSSAFDGLPLSSVAVLCIITALTQNGSRGTTLNKLRRGVFTCLVKCHASDETVSPEDFDILLEMLQGSGLLRISIDNESWHNAKQTMEDIPIVLSDSLDEVDEHVKALILKHSFFCSLYEWATKNVTLI
jgi:Cdc6-like AAA superfamily ATPase